MMLTTTNHKYMCICLGYELFWIKCVLDEGVSSFNRYDNGLMMMMMAYDSFSVIMILFLKWKKSKKYSFVILIRRTNKRTSFVFRFDSFVYQFSESQMVTSSFVFMHSKTFSCLTCDAFHFYRISYFSITSKIHKGLCQF